MTDDLKYRANGIKCSGTEDIISTSDDIAEATGKKYVREYTEDRRIKEGQSSLQVVVWH